MIFNQRGILSRFPRSLNALEGFSLLDAPVVQFGGTRRCVPHREGDVGEEFGVHVEVHLEVGVPEDLQVEVNSR